MKNIVFLFIINAFCNLSYSQWDNSHYCQFANSKIYIDQCEDVKASALSYNIQAQKIVDMICAPISNGISLNFTLIPCNNIPDAVAKTTRDGVRFIIYNPTFIKSITVESGDTNFIGLGILAHEIAHHLIGHTLTYTDSADQRRQELEADEFAGSVLGKLGCSLFNSQAALRSIIHPSCANDKFALHPCLQKRLDACTKGWKQVRQPMNERSVKSENLVRDCEKNKRGDLSITNNTNYSNYEVWVYKNNEISPFQKLKAGINSTVTFNELSGFIKYEIRGFGMSVEQSNFINMIPCKDINIKIWANNEKPTITDIKRSEPIGVEDPNERTALGGKICFNNKGDQTMLVLIRIEENKEIYSRTILPSGEDECIKVPSGLITYSISYYQNPNVNLNLAQINAFMVTEIIKIDKRKTKILFICPADFNQFIAAQYDCSIPISSPPPILRSGSGFK